MASEVDGRSLSDRLFAVKLSGFSELWKALNAPQNKDTLRILIATTCLLLVLPLGVWYATYAYILPVYFHIFATDDRLMYGAFVAIGAVNLVILGYIAYSFTLPEEEEVEENVATIDAKDNVDKHTTKKNK